MSDRDEEISGEVEEPRTFGSHFSARCRWITLAVSIWGFGFLVFEKTGGSTTSLAPDMALVLLLPFTAGLILLLVFGDAQRLGERCEDSFARLVFLGLVLFGLSYIFFVLSVFLSERVEVGGLVGLCMLLLYSVGGLSLLVLGLRQLLARDWRFVDRRVFSLSLFIFWLFIAVFLILMVYSRLTIMRGFLFSTVGLPGRVTFLLFLDSHLDLSQAQSLSRIVSYLIRGPFTWLIASATPILLLKTRSQKMVDLISLARESSRAIGAGLVVLGLCFIYTVPVFILGLQLPEVLLEEVESLHVAMPAATSSLLAAVLLAAGIPLVVRGMKVRLTHIRWPLLGVLVLLAIPSLLSLVRILSSIRPGFHQPDPASVLFPFSTLVTITPLCTLLYWPSLSLSRRRAREYASILVVVVLLISFIPSLVGYYRPVIKDVEVDLVDLGPVGRDRRTQVVVSFSIKNRGPECHRLGAEFRVEDVPTTYPDYMFFEKIDPGATVTRNMTFQVVALKTYRVTIYLYRDVEQEEYRISLGHFLDQSTRKVRIERPETGD